jgi:putative selenate reductase molybdopterin-binding subunit
MYIKLMINGTQFDIETSPSETLFTLLRRLGFYGVKFGDEQGLTGSDTILLDGHPVNAGLLLAVQAEGHKIATIEALGEHPDHGWKKTGGLHPLQLAFIQTGAIQCGYCTPAQILAAKALLDKNPHPSESEVRQAISGVLCRCTGYAKPVQAILQAAAVMRGEKEPDAVAMEPQELPLTGNPVFPDGQSSLTLTRSMPKILLTPETNPYQVVGKPEPKVDAI